MKTAPRALARGPKGAGAGLFGLGVVRKEPEKLLPCARGLRPLDRGLRRRALRLVRHKDRRAVLRPDVDALLT